jgi:hypothetical protein
VSEAWLLGVQVLDRLDVVLVDVGLRDQKGLHFDQLAGVSTIPLPGRVRGLIEACEMMVKSGKACLAPESFLGLDMTIPTEPIGSIPRPQKVITAFEQYERGSLSREEFESICSEAVRETIEKFEATGSPVITDGEQTKPSFATYPIHGYPT